MALGDVDEIVDLVLEYIIVIVPLTTAQFPFVLGHVLQERH